MSRNLLCQIPFPVKRKSRMMPANSDLRSEYSYKVRVTNWDDGDKNVWLQRPMIPTHANELYACRILVLR